MKREKDHLEQASQRDAGTPTSREGLGQRKRAWWLYSRGEIFSLERKGKEVIRVGGEG